MFLGEDDVSVGGSQQPLQRPPRRGIRRDDLKREAGVVLLAAWHRLVPWSPGLPEPMALWVAVLCPVDLAPAGLLRTRVAGLPYAE